MLELMRRYDACYDEFHRIFRVRLERFWNRHTGFDIVGFDEHVIESGDGVMADAIRQKYGEEAVELIYKLLGLEKPNAKNHA